MKKILSIVLFTSLILNGQLFAAEAAVSPDDSMVLEEETHGRIIDSRESRKRRAEDEIDEEQAQRRRLHAFSESEYDESSLEMLTPNKLEQENSREEKSSFIRACLEGDLDKVISELNEGMNPHYKIKLNLSLKRNEQYRKDFDRRLRNGKHLTITPMIAAINYGYTNIVAALLKAKAHVDEPLELLGEYMYPLSFAAQRGFTTITQLLLDAGAHPSKGRIRLLERQYNLPETIARDSGHTRLANVLKEKTGQIEALYTACRIDDRHEFNKLLREGVNPHMPKIKFFPSRKLKIEECSPLEVAVQSCNIWITKKLILSGANLEHAQTSLSGIKLLRTHQTTLLINLVCYCSEPEDKKLEMAQLLLSSGVNVHKGDNHYNSPLEGLLDSVEEINPRLVALLLKHGASQIFVTSDLESSLPEQVQFALRWARRKPSLRV